MTRRHYPAGLLLAAALAITIARCLVGCAAALPFVAPIADGLVAVIEAEAQRAGVPPGDPAYQAALAAAQALELEAATASAATQARLDAIVAEMHQRRTSCRADAGATATSSRATSSSTAAVFPSTPAALPILDAGADR